MRSPSRVRRLGVLAVGVGVLMAVTMTSCSSSTTSPAPRPATDRACVVTATPAGPVTLPLQVAGSTASAADLFSVSMCIDGHGPYPFLVDTGQAVSVITPTLADELHLHRAGKMSLGAVSCRSGAPAAVLDKWSVGGVSLDAQDVAVAPVPDTDLTEIPDGVLGSDVLGRFDTIRVDYPSHQLTMLAPEAGLPTQPTLVRGATTPVSSELVSGTPAAVVPLVVVQSTSGTLASAPVSFARGALAHFVVDSGSAISSIDSSLARSLHLTGTGNLGSAPGVGCPSPNLEVHSGAWRLGSLRLPSIPLVSMSYVRVAGQIAAGTVGADVLSRFGSFVLDYRSAQLILEGH